LDILRRFVHSIPQKTLTGEQNSCYEQPTLYNY
jgi:hypothetical protein